MEAGLLPFSKLFQSHRVSRGVTNVQDMHLVLFNDEHRPPILKVANSCRGNPSPPCYNRGMTLSQEASVSPCLQVSPSPCLGVFVASVALQHQRVEGSTA
jgi:hypothetical protein